MPVITVNATSSPCFVSLKSFTTELSLLFLREMDSLKTSEKRLFWPILGEFQTDLDAIVQGKA